jgi:hypothetical protein
MDLRKESVLGWLDEMSRLGGGQWGLQNYQINVGGPFGGTSLHFHYATMSGLMFGRKRCVILGIALYSPNTPDPWSPTRHCDARIHVADGS